MVGKFLYNFNEYSLEEFVKELNGFRKANPEKKLYAGINKEGYWFSIAFN